MKEYKVCYINPPQNIKDFEEKLKYKLIEINGLEVDLKDIEVIDRYNEVKEFVVFSEYDYTKYMAQSELDVNNPHLLSLYNIEQNEITCQNVTTVERRSKSC